MLRSKLFLLSQFNDVLVHEPLVGLRDVPKLRRELGLLIVQHQLWGVYLRDVPGVILRGGGNDAAASERGDSSC